MNRLFNVVKVHTGYDIRERIRIVICDDEEQFKSILEGMRKKGYSLPSRGKVDALYFSEDRYIVVSPNVRAGTSSFDRVILHEMFHNIFQHEIPRDVGDRLRKAASRRRGEISNTFSSVGRKMPWSIEERLAEMFSYAICPHIQKGTSSIRRLSLEILEPMMK